MRRTAVVYVAGSIGNVPPWTSTSELLRLRIESVAAMRYLDTIIADHPKHATAAQLLRNGHELRLAQVDRLLNAWEESNG